MRPSSSPFLNPSGLVDKRLAPMWAQIEQINALLPQVAHVSYYMESIFNLDRNLTLLADENVDHHILKDITIFQGKNAYETAVEEGYVGDVTSWLASLVGPQGPQGPQGVTDAVTLQQIQDDLTAGTAGRANLQSQLDALTLSLDGYVTDGEFATFQTANTAAIAQVRTDTVADVNVILDQYVSSTEAQTYAQQIFDTSIVPYNNDILTLDGRLDTADGLLAGLRTDHDALSTNYGSFLVQNALEVARITALEATAGANTASIVAIESVNSSQAAIQTTLQAESATAQSDISALQLASSTQATQINVLQTTSGNQGSAITSLEATTLSQATSLTALTTRVDDAESDITSLFTTTANQASSILTLQTDVGNNTSAISSEATTRASETGALASRADTLELDVSGLQGSVSTNASLIGDINGRMTARYAIAVDGGGNGSFISLQDGVSTPSKIELDAALIELNGDVIITGSLDTPQMAANAVTERSVTNDTSTRAIASNQTHTTVESTVYNKTQADSDIRIDFHCRHEGSTAIAGDDYAIEIHIRRNGTTQTLGDFWYYKNQGFPHSEFGSITISGVPAGNSTWTLTVKASNGGGISGVTVTRTQFAIEEIKK